MDEVAQSSQQESGSRVRSIPISGKLDDRNNVRENPRPFEELPPEIQLLLLDKRRKDSKERSTVRMMEGKYVLSLLLYLEKMSPVLKSDIYNDISRSASMADKLNDLHTLGLIQIYYTVRSNSNVVVITDKGRLAAATLRQLIGIVES